MADTNTQGGLQGELLSAIIAEGQMEAASPAPVSTPAPVVEEEETTLPAQAVADEMVETPEAEFIGMSSGGNSATVIDVLTSPHYAQAVSQIEGSDWTQQHAKDHEDLSYTRHQENVTVENKKRSYTETYGGVREYIQTSEGKYEYTSATNTPAGANGTQVREGAGFPKMTTASGDGGPYTSSGIINPNTGTEGVIVRETSGDVYTYTNGDNYTWGDGRDFEFGNGYTESHIDRDGTETSARTWTDWPSMSESAFAGDSLVEKTWTGGGADDKTKGVYEYRNGFAMEYVEGNSEGYTDGDVYEKHISGTVESVHEDGDITELIGSLIPVATVSNHFGTSTETHFGPTLSITGGAFAEVFLGGQVEYTFAGHAALEIAGMFELFIGGKLELHAAAKFEAAPIDAKEIYVMKTTLELMQQRASAMELQTDGLETRSNALEAKQAGLESDMEGAFNGIDMILMFA